LYGILNGINYDEFDPEKDKNIAKNYTAQSFSDKKENKYALQKEMGFEVGDVPLIGLISRLSGQKGLNLIIDKIDRIMNRNIQFVLLGTGDEYYQDSFRRIADQYRGRFAANIGFDSALAQRIYAGCDMFLMPSRFEPCGLGQIISLRYGTIPIVRATGGLAETIKDYDADNEDSNGFSFKNFSSDEMMDAIDRAIKLYENDHDRWDSMAVRAMNMDFSWNSSAKKYVELYNTALKMRA
jgi:starch synthase